MCFFAEISRNLESFWGSPAVDTVGASCVGKWLSNTRLSLRGGYGSGGGTG